MIFRLDLILKYFFLDFCFSVKMRMQLLKIVVVLLVAGSGDTRPQNGGYSTGNYMTTIYKYIR